MTRITLVYKLKSDGLPCRACAEVLALLRRDGFDAQIDRTVVADERDFDSEGWELARRYCVRSAPFFLVEQDGIDRIYTSYQRLVSDVLKPGRAAVDFPNDEAVLEIL